MKRPILLSLTLLVAACTPPAVELEPGAHIVLVGNALADRMQHHGWLEAYLQAALPDYELVIRNHGLSGDRVDHRPRSEGFPSPDDYLGLSQATVIFAMFGYNESYDDDAPAYGVELTNWITHTRVQDYSGHGPPNVVLFSPIAHENLNDPNLPDGIENNVRLARYTEATEAVAREQGVAFIDLYSASQRLFEASDEPLTLDGVHLNEIGNRQIAEVIVREVTGRAPSTDTESIEAIRTAVLDKNLHWFNRYRATDGNDVWGTRSTLAFTDGQTNYDVLQQELVQFDRMTANRDRVIWAVARGESIQPDDSDVPAAVEVVSNLDEPQEQGGVSKLGSLDFLTAEQGIDQMRLEPGLSANVFASEEMFPELVNPVQLGVDTRGRLWAATWGTYPKWEPTGEMNDRLLILPDDDRNGVADRAITFAYVQNPTGFEFWNGGVLVASVPDLLFLKDTDGDDVADVRIRIMGGLGSADTHHSANNFVYGPDGFLYYQRGIFNVSNVESPWTTNQESGVAGMYRFNPRTREFSFHAPNPPNPHGISFDYWGYHYATDGTNGAAFQVKPNRDGTFEMRSLLDHTVRPVPSSGIISSTHLPPRMEGNFIILNVIAFLGIKQYTLGFDEVSGDVTGTETADLLLSSDPDFRPADFEIGDDGALYVADWANAIIGHMQHNIRDPARDHTHGRIYRVTAPGRPLQAHVELDGQPIPVLLTALQHPVNGVRQRARVELSERPTSEVISEMEAWIAQWDPSEPEHAHHLLEALWLHQQHNVENQDLLDLVLNSPVAHARIAARTVERMWEHNAAAPVRMSSADASADGGPAAAARPDLGDDAIVIKTVMEQMRYDIPAFTVAAGATVTILFDNEDYTPHNLVIAQPGSGEAVGTAADALGAQGFVKQFIPDSDEIIVASDLLSYGEFEVLTFTAPTEPADYEVLCTFPGHRGTMHGIMTVEQ